MKKNICLRMFIREILSWDETLPGTKRSLSVLKFSLLKCFCQDETSSRNEKQKKRCVNTYMAKGHAS